MGIEYPSHKWKDYELLDSGHGEKLERFGRYVMVRPEPKALWQSSMSERDWLGRAHVRFVPGAGFGRAGKEDSGTWQLFKRMDEQWYIGYDGYTASEAISAVATRTIATEAGTTGAVTASGPKFRLRLGLTSFKHVGIFPEQASNWEYIYSRTRALAEKAAGRTAPRVLNLFAYTGAASLAARAAGADVIHLDSVRQVVTWANVNMTASHLDGIRWVVEDAMKFVRREARRGNTYQGIILDPPAYGHGPDGEKWKLDECLYEMLRNVAFILAPKDSFMVLNLYSNGFSPLLGATLVKEAFGLNDNTSQAVPDRIPKDNVPAPSAATTSPTGTKLDYGEMALRDGFGKILPLSIFVRMEK